ncbi:MAG: RDD family protein [Candidatus Shapirobacteria bacterium]|jgi:uncharacterized RDD family membrane protein YckC
MGCHKCHKEISPAAKFCNYCGEPVLALATLPAPSGLRFLNLFLDNIFQYSIIFVLVIAFSLVKVLLSKEPSYDPSFEQVLASILRPAILVLHFVYYISSEALWQRSPAKFITGTKVVSSTGGKPLISQIIIRSLCRLIPFEHFSFFGKNPVGLHDKISKTIVVKA